MSNWRILDFTGAKVALSTERGKLVVTSKETAQVKEISWDSINLILTGLETDFRGGVLHQAVKFDVVCLFTDWKFLPVGGVYPMSPESNHNRVSARQNAQAEVSLPRKKNAWMRIVRAKILGQANVLQNSGDTQGASRLVKIASEVKTGDPSNCEGTAAKFYWSRLFGERFRRNRDEADFLNAALNYAYTVLRGHAIRAVLSAGLNPTIGLFHHNRSNFFCLADDLMEPFRPTVDAVIAQMRSEIEAEINLTSETKRLLVDACESKVLTNGLTIPSVMNDLAQRLGRYYEGEVETLEVPSWALRC